MIVRHSHGLRSVLDALATLAIVTACAVFVWAVLTRASSSNTQPQSAPSAPAGGRNPKPLPSDPIDIKNATVRGKPSAKLAVIQYSDFQCPFCVKFASETLPEIIEKLVDTGKIQFAFRHLPLQSLHPFAFKAAEAAECGGSQGKFWEVHDALFAVSGRLDPKSLKRIVEITGLDARRFGTCIKGETTERVKLDLAEARSFGITGTPTFLFGRIQADGKVKVIRREAGALPSTTFSQIIDELLNQ